MRTSFTNHVRVGSWRNLRIAVASGLLVLFGSLSALAQERTISGTVTSAENGEALPGVNVVLKNTTIGTVTDIEGTYRLSVPEEGGTLTFSFIGLEGQEVEIGSQSVINMEMSEDAQQLSEVVVTGLGMEREEASLGYAVQEIDGEGLVKARETNLVNSLSGKVAGVQITGSSNIGGSSRVLVRGANSIRGDNQPLFVVDGTPIDNSNFTTNTQAAAGGGYDYGNAAQDLNPDDIASITVLKGPAASAIYGSRGSNGVIEITTKKGSARKGVGISVNSGLSFQQVYVLPDYQNQYGAALILDENGERVLDADGYPIINHGLDGSWGAPLDGSVVTRHWDSYDEWDTENFGVARPMLPSPNNVEDFFRLGRTWNNNIALSGGNDLATFRLSYTNLSQQGTQENSNLERNTVNFSGSVNLTERLTAGVTANYINTDVKGRPGTGYGDRNVMQMFNQWYQRQLDTDRLRNYVNPDGTQRTWNRKGPGNPAPNYFNNPFLDRYVNYQQDARNRIFGNMSLSYEFTDWLTVTGRAMTDRYTDRREERAAIGSVEEPFYEEVVREVSESNFDLIANVNTNISEDISFSGFVGGNIRLNNQYRNEARTQDGLNIPNFFNILNSGGNPRVDDYFEEKRVNSLFGSASFGYRDFLYLDVTARNDWSSTLPEGNNSYFYPSATGSFVFSELVSPNWLSLGKVRVGWAQVGNDTDPYRLASTYIPIANYGSFANATVPNVLNNANLKPEITTAWEVGAQVGFFNNRLNLDATYYDSETRDQIFAVDVSGATGYSSRVVNAGRVTNRGVELMLNITPIQLNNSFQWDVSVNWARNINQVAELTEDTKTIRLASLFGVYVEAKEGETYGAITGPTVAVDRNTGKYIVDANGRYVEEPNQGVVGSVLADWTGGLSNTFSFKGFRLSALIDMQQGGSLYSLSHMWGRYSGVLAETAGNNTLGNPLRDPVVVDNDGNASPNSGGVILDAVVQSVDSDNNPVVDEDGYPVSDGTVNTTAISANRWGGDHYSRGRASQNVFDASFVKLREVQFGYSLPGSLIEGTPFTNVTISLVGRNLAILHKNIPHVDPEGAVSSSNIQGFEGGQLPTERSFGVNVNLKF